MVNDTLIGQIKALEKHQEDSHTATSNDARHTKITQDKPPANDGYPVQGVFGGGNTLVADMVVTGGNAPFDTLIQEIEITLDYYRTEFPKTSEHNKQVWADPIDVHACGVSADDLEQIKTILQQRELPVVTVDAHVEFWKAEYKRLACAGVERMAELGYKVAPAEKMIEAAEYREKKILGSPYPKREQGGLNFDDIEKRLHAERDRLISHNISWDVADVMNVLRMNAPKRETITRESLKHNQEIFDMGATHVKERELITQKKSVDTCND